jgi:hypothetical protein
VDVDELQHALGGIVLEAAYMERVLRKEALLAALRACHQTNRERNRVIHDAWATRPGNLMVTLKGGRTSHEVRVTARTLAEVPPRGPGLRPEFSPARPPGLGGGHRAFGLADAVAHEPCGGSPVQGYKG